ncbi:MAG TPA: methyltransferase domain-containing protein, partial [Thermoleophilaceae bacterium]
MPADGAVDLLARTVRGVEWIAAAEIHGRLGTEATAVAHREVRFRLDRLDPATLELGTVDDVFLVVGEAPAVGHTRDQLARIADAAAGCAVEPGLALLRPLRAILGVPSFDVTATFLGKRNFNRFEVEDAAGAAIARCSGWLYRSRTAGKPAPTAVTVRVHLDAERTVLALRVGAAPLHRRPYRESSRSASLRPPVARCLGLLAGLGNGVALLDPFCGAGTIPIEAALAEPGVVASGSDAEPEVVELARANVAAAGVQAAFDVADAAALDRPDGSVDRLATNPPWGDAVEPVGSLASAWREARRVLRDGGRAAIVAPGEIVDGAARALGSPPVLRQAVRILGKPAEIAVLAEDEGFAGSGLYGAELDRAR